MRTIKKLASALAVAVALTGAATPALADDGVPTDVNVAPPNDDFAGASSLATPAEVTVDVVAATVEPAEPAPAPISASAWYTFTPAASGTFVLATNFDDSNVVGLYTGPSLTQLAQVGAITQPFQRIVFSGQAGTTYHIQVAKHSSVYAFYSWVTLVLQQAADPIADFFATPFDPSAYDTMQFIDTSVDPAYIGFASNHWDFGDGATASGCCVSHRYAADGDYTVTLTATTVDGRTASVTRTVAVRTHDVSIERIQVPNSARVGQTRNVGVNLRGGAYPETVQVHLWKSVAGGDEAFVGTQTISVPAARGGHTTAATLGYTFTSEDAVAGKVTFRAVAHIEGFRDALPADNQAIGPPTEVKP